MPKVRCELLLMIYNRLSPLHRYRLYDVNTGWRPLRSYEFTDYIYSKISNIDYTMYNLGGR